MRKYPAWRLALSWAGVGLLVLWAAACVVPVRAVNGLLITVCMTPVGIVVNMSDGSQTFKRVQDLGDADREVLEGVPEERRYVLEVCR